MNEESGAMPCHRTSNMIICSHQSQPRCKFCRAPAPILCDFPVSTHKSGTYDVPCCRRHAVNVGPDRDFCLTHHQALAKGELHDTSTE